MFPKQSMFSLWARTLGYRRISRYFFMFINTVNVITKAHPPFEAPFPVDVPLGEFKKIDCFYKGI